MLFLIVITSLATLLAHTATSISPPNVPHVNLVEAAVGSRLLSVTSVNFEDDIPPANIFIRGCQDAAKCQNTWERTRQNTVASAKGAK